MQIDLNLYRIFYTVANTLNITKAAEILHVSQPAVTKSIKQLEYELGGNLFIRSKKGVLLTDEARQIYNYIEDSLKILENTKNKFDLLINSDVGKIRIGTGATITKYYLMPFISKFHLEHPNIEIQIITGLTQNLIKQLRNGSLDLILVSSPIDLGKDIKSIDCLTTHDIFVCSKHYIKDKTKINSLSELSKHSIIALPTGSNSRNSLDKLMKENDIDYNIYMEVSSFNLQLDFIKEGFGIGYVIKEYVQSELDSGTLIQIKIDKKIPSRKLCLATIKNVPLNYASKIFIDTLIK